MAVKVFVSSTYLDLKDHRQRVITQLRRAGYHVDPMEDWTSDADEPRQFSVHRLDGCQVCVLLVGFRRGFIPPGHTRSITQMEYDDAIAHGIDVLPYLLDDGVIGWPAHHDDRTKDPLLKEWREALGLHHGVERFTADPTSVDVLPALSRWKDRHYAWEQLETAGFTPATQLQFHDLTVGGHVLPRGGTLQPLFGDTRRADLDSRNRRAMIEKVWAIWITGVLQPSLPQDILLELGLTERPAEVTRALDLLVQRPDLADRELAPGTSLIEVFDRLDRALLMLGAPGAGKTTLLLTLARDLLQRAGQDPVQPIPVIFPLSSWAAQRRPLRDWLVDELQQRYDVPRTIGQGWVDADQVLPLLDGLDEVQAEHRADCAEAINTFRQDHGLLPLTVCSRMTEYEALGLQLRLQGAIVVQPLTHAQVDSYLAQVGQPLAAVRMALQEDPLLWELLDTPLMLTIVTLAYAGQPIEGLRTGETLVERRQSLFATYVDRMFQRRSAVTRYTRAQTERWLSWLAVQMTQHGQTVFHLERMQPTWLPYRLQPRLQYFRWRTTVRIGTLVFLLTLLVAGRLVGFILGTAAVVGVYVGALRGLRDVNEELRRRVAASGICVDTGQSVKQIAEEVWRRAATGGPHPTMMIREVLQWWLTVEEITSVDTLHWSWSAFEPWQWRILLIWILISGLFVGVGTGVGTWLRVAGTVGLKTGVTAGLNAGVAAGLNAAGTIGLETGVTIGLFTGVAWMLLWGLVFVPGGALTSSEIETKTVPNEGIRRSARNALFMGLMGGMVGGIAGGLLAVLSYGLGFQSMVGVLSVLGFGLSFGLAAAMRYGGYTWLQHCRLRRLLVRRGLIPRHYVDFLDYAAERVFLRRVGGGYIFIHRLLQEYFAGLYQPDRGDSPPQPSPPPP